MCQKILYEYHNFNGFFGKYEVLVNSDFFRRSLRFFVSEINHDIERSSDPVDDQANNDSEKYEHSFQLCTQPGWSRGARLAIYVNFVV